MRILAWIVGFLVLLIAGGALWWHIKYPTYAYRYRLTIALEVDGKVHTGSSVIEIEWAGGPGFGDVGPYHPRVRGEGALVDLESRGVVLAALINGESYGPAPDGALGALWITPRAFGKNSSLQQLPDLPRLLGRRDLKPDNMPRLIWFPSRDDPATGRKFTIKDIPDLFGPSSRLATAYVEITRDPIVIDIDKKLPWYGQWTQSSGEVVLIRQPDGTIFSRGLIRLSDGTMLSRYMVVGDAS